MQDALGQGSTLGYCTNVHPAGNLDELRDSLRHFTLPVKRRVSPDAPMGVGLWFPSNVMQQLIAREQGVAELRGWLTDRGLYAYTLNGFPFGNFHQPVVKRDVYLPDWTDEDRYQYTLGLASILAELLPDEATEGSISTLPLGWPSSFASMDAQRQERCAAQLMRLVHSLARIELNTGKHIHVDLEPEPGCILETSAGLVRFFEQYLLGGPDDVSVLGYLRVCHDVCHAAVMFEDQRDALNNYRDAGIKIGKAQLSSALRIDFDAMDADTRLIALRQLQGFAEQRYLHQTCVRTDDGRVTAYTDLPDALQDHTSASTSGGGEWRVHFHVPVYLDEIGALGTTRGEIKRYLDARVAGDETAHFEVETYAWNVLPPAVGETDLAEGIALELRSVTEGRP